MRLRHQTACWALAMVALVAAMDVLAVAGDDSPASRPAATQEDMPRLRIKQERVAALMATAQANDTKEKGSKAIQTLDRLLKLDPGNSAAKALRKKIVGYYRDPQQALVWLAK